MSPADVGEEFVPSTEWRTSHKSANSGDCVQVAAGKLLPAPVIHPDAEKEHDQH